MEQSRAGVVECSMAQVGWDGAQQGWPRASGAGAQGSIARLSWREWGWVEESRARLGGVCGWLGQPIPVWGQGGVGRQQSVPGAGEGWLFPLYRPGLSGEWGQAREVGWWWHICLLFPPVNQEHRWCLLKSPMKLEPRAVASPQNLVPGSTF